MTFFETIGKIIERYSSFFAQGVVNTLIIAAFSVLLGTILGTLMATMRMGKILPLKWLAVAYIEFIRGTPLMVQLMFIFYGLPMIGVTFPSVSFIPDFDRFAAGIVAMSLNSCAYVAEIIRSGIQAVDKGQMEAGRSLGLSYGVTMKKIILPQAVKNILPALGNEFIALIKETSVDLTRAARSIVSKTYDPLVPYLVLALMYLVLVLIATVLVHQLERVLHKSD